MIGIVLTLLSALAASLAVVLVRKRLDESNFFSVAFVITIIGNTILWPLALVFANLRAVSLYGVLLFVIAGVLAPGIARLLYYKGMKVVGVSINASIFAAYPMYSSVLAVLILGEILVPENWIGILCIVLGVISIERNLSSSKAESKRISKRGLALPLLSSIAIATSQIIRKHGLNIYNEPFLGVALGYLLSFLLYLLVLVSSNATRDSLSLGRDFQLFWKAGVLMTLAWVFAFFALSYERVSIVTPILQIEPLFVFLFTYLYLKELERISFRLVAITLLILVGVMLVSIR